MDKLRVKYFRRVINGGLVGEQLTEATTSKQRMTSEHKDAENVVPGTGYQSSTLLITLALDVHL